ncbi:MAG: hypothetical protein M0Z39_09715 [Actinomycetota bacterium]|nr:hypothetical protein [Actinomycetota bacterium]
MRVILRWLIAACAALASLLIVSGTAAAQSSALTVIVQQLSPASDNLTMAARLSPAVVGQKVTFFVDSQEFSGHSWMAVGSATTNSSGDATYTYTPTWTGTTEFGAAIGSGTSVAAPTAVESFQVLKDPTGVPESAIEYARPMGSIGGVLVKALLGIVAIVWILLLGSLILVIRRMPRLAGAGESGHKGGR